jgi:hypothetical protein
MMKEREEFTMQLDGEVTALETWKDFVFIAIRIKDDAND